MLAKAASYIPYSIVLLDSQGCAVSSVSTEEQAPQIGRLAADNRKQFRVRAWPARKRLTPGAHQVAHGLVHRTVFGSRGGNTFRIYLQDNPWIIFASIIIICISKLRF